MFKNYNINQFVLLLDLEFKLHKDAIAYAVNDLVEAIPEEAFAGCGWPKDINQAIVLSTVSESILK